ncbi:MAG: MATE family efflux transporter [Rhodobacteraceae bacterium]|nr:MATE family efflux transporter [Paracoccaceae bacterium]
MTHSAIDFQKSQPISHRDVFAIAIPMTLAYLSTPLLGVVDTVVIGRLGDASLIGGIALGGVIFDIIFTIFNFLRTGTTGLTAQALGANNKTEINATFLRALALGVGFGLLVLCLYPFLLRFGLIAMGGSDNVQSATSRYFEIRVFSAPLLLVNYVILGWFIGLGRAKTALLLQLILNGLNIILSVWFVYGLEWSVEGVAFATVLSECVACVFGIFLVLRIAPKKEWPDLKTIFDRERFSRMLGVNRDIMIRSFCLIFAYAFFANRSAAQGDVILAANVILEKLLMIGAHFLDGLATAAEQLAGKAMGERSKRHLLRSHKLTFLWSFIMASIVSGIYLTVGPMLLDFMTTTPEIRDVGRSYILWAALSPLFGFLAFQMDGVFIGTTWTRDMRNMMLLSVLVYVGLYFAIEPILGNHGLWLALMVLLGARGLALLFLFKHRVHTLFDKTPV